ncbi:Aste57867_9960 [Aphanomyces stellatus]|uniref:Aste57867_9960 protein n=1 Tax=Aphanomyces stellatus TaxID=120398 RepID=A0A485KPM4_9STRA|nr:hypothetical protein As57867_009921 [Aphanomyces stellatus]VFT86838.1 Aste57867_9960 [Aphanomyces stellatus]
MHLQDATAIITGAARGLGLEFTRSILTAGGRVFMTDIDETELSASCKLLQEAHPGRVACMRQNVTDMDSFDAAFDAANRAFHPHQVNVLVNNAGVMGPALKFYADAADASWTRVIDINLTSVIRGTQVALHRLSTEKGLRPVVVNVSSIAGFVHAPQVPIYTASKTGVVAFTKAVGQSKKVRVVALCPAFTDTAMGVMGIQEDANMVKGFGGLMTTAYVAEGFVKCVEEEDNAGAAMTVTNRDGFKYHGMKKASKL